MVLGGGKRATCSVTLGQDKPVFYLEIDCRKRRIEAKESTTHHVDILVFPLFLFCSLFPSSFAVSCLGRLSILLFGYRLFSGLI